MKSLYSWLVRGTVIAATLLSFALPAQAACDVTFNGSAAFGPGGSKFFRLTPSAPAQVGSVWLTNKRFVGDGFRTSFYFRISNPGGIEGADGFAFVVQNDSNTALGSAGGGIGYDGIPKSVAVEFDTYQNVFGCASDPDNNHISIHTDGTNPNSVDECFSVGSTSIIPNLSDGNVHFVQIGYVSGKMSVWVDGSLVLSKAVSLTPAVDSLGRAYLGFTAATGAGYEIHDIGGWCLVTF
jgi:hypothetical protein